MSETTKRTTAQTCWECGTTTSDYVMERRATGGDQWGWDYSRVPICNNRRECQARQRDAADQRTLERLQQAVLDTKAAYEKAEQELAKVLRERAKRYPSEADRDV
jgi:hypothetical protein